MRASAALIDGCWRAPASARRLIQNPATLQPVCELPELAPADLEAAVAAARRAGPSWNRRTPAERAALLALCGQRLREQAAECAELHAQEAGQAYAECLDSVFLASRLLCNSANHVPAPGAPDRLAADAARALCLSCDCPIVDFGARVAGALVCGATLVCIPPAGRPLAVLRAAAAFDALPPGVLNVIAPSEPGFLRGCAGLEPYRGHGEPAERADCVVVGPGADLELAAAGIASLRLFHCGQRRGQSTRVFVDAALLDAMADHLHQQMAFLEAGDPRRPGTDLGPLGSSAALHAAEMQVGNALRQGAALRLGGRRYQPWGLGGYFLQPTLLLERRCTDAHSQDIAAPVVILAPVESLIPALTRGRNGTARRWRISLFAADPGPLVQEVGAAGIRVRTVPYAASIERVREAVDVGPADDGVLLEHLTTRQSDWFPYSTRVPWTERS